MATRKGGLGRGLDALIPTSIIPQDITTPSGVVVADRNEVDINLISPNPKQPRTVFDEEQLAELALSIKEVGLLQPPVVRSIGNGKYQLIMGERRYRASKLAGLKSIPVIIRQTPDDQLLREALVENIHRSQLNPLEEGGKSRPAITNTMRLLNLPASVQRRVAAGVLSAGHARALLSLTNEKEIEALANRIVAEGLTVRAVEEIVSTGAAKLKGGSVKRGKILAPRLKEISDQLSDTLDTRVNVELGKQKGKIVIEFATMEDLERITKLIN
jgi:ParB family chromosome partitioning protein